MWTEGLVERIENELEETILDPTGRIANAVYHATGRRRRSLPITIDQLL